MLPETLIFLLTITKIYAATTVDPYCTRPSTPDFDPKPCCNFDKIEINGILFETLECNAIHPTKEADWVWDHPTIKCFGECLLNATGVIKNNQFNPVAARKFFSLMLNRLDETVPEQTIQDGIDTCGPLIQKQYSFISNVAENKCSDFASFFMGCVQTYVFKNCPPKLWNQSEICNKLQKDAQKCSLFYALF